MIKKRTTAPATATKAEAPKTVVKEARASVSSPSGRVEKTVEEVEVPILHGFVRIGRSFTVKREDDFIKVSADISLPASPDEIEDGSAREKLSDLLTTYLDAEAATAMEQYGALTGNVDNDDVPEPEADEEEAPAPAKPKRTASKRQPEPEPEPEADETADGDDAGVTPEQIRAMKRAEVEALIEEYGVEVDPDEFGKDKAGNTALKEAVIAAAGLEDDDDATAEEADDADATEASAEDDDGITEEAIREMDRETLVEVIDQYELEIDHKKITKLDKLRDAVVEAMSEDDTAEEGADESGEGYSQEELESLTTDDLKAIFADESWGLGKYPTGPDKVTRKLAIGKILKAQNGE